MHAHKHVNTYAFAAMHAAHMPAAHRPAAHMHICTMREARCARGQHVRAVTYYLSGHASTHHTPMHSYLHAHPPHGRCVQVAWHAHLLAHAPDPLQAHAVRLHSRTRVLMRRSMCEGGMRARLYGRLHARRRGQVRSTHTHR